MSARFALLYLAGVLLLGCGGHGGGGQGSSGSAAPAPLPPVTAGFDPLPYLAQSKNPDGNPLTPLSAGDRLLYRRFDLGHYQAEDAFLAGSGAAITAWSYPPFGAFSAAAEAGCPGAPCRGDGGEQYAVDGDTVRIAATRDGSQAQDQWFVGKDCGGTGWVLFRSDATADWKDVVARLWLTNDPSQCLPISSAYTRYSLQSVSYPGLGPVPSIVSEHYNGADMASAVDMERFFLGRGWGRLAWQRFAHNPPPVDTNRCPDFGWSAPPAPGLTLADCRILTQLAPADGTLSAGQLWQP